MKKLASITIFAALLNTACTTSLPQQAVSTNATAIDALALEVTPEFSVTRTKRTKITKPYYKDCMVEHRDTTLQAFTKRYSATLTAALNEKGIRVADDAAYKLDIGYHIVGNADFGTYNVYLAERVHTPAAANERPFKYRRQAPYRLTHNMPSGLSKWDRNAYCAARWERFDSQLQSEIDQYSKDMVDKTLKRLTKLGLL